MAGEKTFPFEILTLQKLFLREEVRFVIAPGQEGVFEILPNHAPFVFALKPGPLRIRMHRTARTSMSPWAADSSSCRKSARRC